MQEPILDSTLGPAGRYKTTTYEPRGICLILNNETFEDNATLSPRVGTNNDRDKLYAIFQALKFDVRCYNDVSNIEMLDIITRASLEDHSLYDCFVCCILSHGIKGAVYGSNGRTIQIRKLTERLCPLSCPTLSGKPKVFIIQACQGTAVQRGHLETQTDAVMAEEELIPNEADFLIAYSTVLGYVAYRDVNEGSYFIQALVETLYKYAHKCELLRILTKVNDTVGRKNFCSEGGMDPKKQSPAQFSTLRKSLYLSRTSLCAGPHPSSAPVVPDQWSMDDASRKQQQPCDTVPGVTQRVPSAYGHASPHKPTTPPASIQAPKVSRRPRPHTQGRETEDDVTMATVLQMLEEIGLGKHSDMLCQYPWKQLQRMSADEMRKLGLPRKAQDSLLSALHHIKPRHSLRSTSPVSSSGRLSTSQPPVHSSASQGDHRRLSNSASKSSSGVSSTLSFERQLSLPSSLRPRSTREDSREKKSSIMKVPSTTTVRKPHRDST